MLSTTENLNAYTSNENDTAICDVIHSNNDPEIRQINFYSKKVLENSKEDQKTVKVIQISQRNTKIPKLTSKGSNYNFLLKNNDKLQIQQQEKLIISSKNYQRRKSHTQMDFRSPNRKASGLRRAISNDKMKQSFQNSEARHHFVKNNNEPNNECDTRIAGMKIFGAIMLNAWRQRRADVKNLKEEVDRMEKNNGKSRNQIHILNSLLKIEQKQNNSLKDCLKKAQDDQQKIKKKYEKLNANYNELKNQKSIIENNLEFQYRENENLVSLIEQSKCECSKITYFENDLKESYKLEQKRSNELESGNKTLFEKINNLDSNYQLKEFEYESKINQKDKIISDYKSKLIALEKKLNEFKSIEIQLREYQSFDIIQRKIIHNLGEEMNFLQNELNNSFLNRMKTFIRTFPDRTLPYIHFASFYLLPAVPPPSSYPQWKISLPFAIEKVICNVILNKM